MHTFRYLTLNVSPSRHVDRPHSQLNPLWVDDGGPLFPIYAKYYILLIKFIRVLKDLLCSFDTYKTPELRDVRPSLKRKISARNTIGNW